MIFYNLSEEQKKFLSKFREKRKFYLSLGITSLLLFLTIVYLGPLDGYEKLGLLAQKKLKEITRADSTVKGTVEVFLEADHSHNVSKTTYKINTGGNNYLDLDFTDGPPSLRSGDEVEVAGTISGKTLTVNGKDPAQFKILKGATLTNESIGNQRLLFVAVNFQNLRAEPFDMAFAEARIRETDDFYRASSYGKTWFTWKNFLVDSG